MTDAVPTKACIACGHAIPERASLCSECGSYQKRWRNNLKYLANIIAVFTVLFGVIFFSISIKDEVLKTLFWKDSIVILTLSTIGPTAIGNTGDGKIFVSDIHISNVPEFDRRFSKTISIGKFINPGEVIQIAITEERKEKTQKFLFAKADSAAEASEKIRKSESFKIKPLNTSACFIHHYYVEQDPEFVRVSRFLSDKMITFPVLADVGVYSIRMQKWIRQPVKVIAVVKQNRSVQCLRN